MQSPTESRPHLSSFPLGRWFNTILLLSLPAMAAQSMAGEHVTVTLYHHVSDSTPSSTSISPDIFAQQMAVLQNEGYTVMALPAVLESLHNQQSLPDKAIAITFDDGYLSIYDTAFPMLQALDFPFTVFVNTQPINNGLPGYMSWEQIREMSDAGVTIANHMVNHPHMIDALDGETTAQRIQRLRTELLQAQETIREQTGQDHRFMAYPYGEYDQDIKQLLTDLGFDAFGQQSGAIGYHSDFLALPRYPFGGSYTDLQDFRQKTKTLAFNVLGASPDSPITEDKSPSVTVKFGPGEYHINELACYAGGQPMTMEWIDKVEGELRISTEQQFSSRRFRYLCTAPHLSERTRYFWYSKDWTRSTQDNQD
jgi:biofilm PGA synthesis lipoprotein PgaB